LSTRNACANAAFDGEVPVAVRRVHAPAPGVTDAESTWLMNTVPDVHQVSTILAVPARVPGRTYPDSVYAVEGLTVIVGSVGDEIWEAEVAVTVCSTDACPTNDWAVDRARVEFRLFVHPVAFVSNEGFGIRFASAPW
jgi:hypothetical protein